MVMSSYWRISTQRPQQKHEDTISPKIFTAAMGDIFKKLNLEERGLNVDGAKLTDLRFADDVALIATSVKD